MLISLVAYLHTLYSQIRSLQSLGTFRLLENFGIAMESQDDYNATLENHKASAAQAVYAANKAKEDARAAPTAAKMT